MKVFPIAVLLNLLMIFGCKQEKDQTSALNIDVRDAIVIPEHYIVGKISDSIIIDGIASEESWEIAQFTQDFIDIEGKKTPDLNTRVKMLWDSVYLYVYSEMEEPHIWGYLKQRDTVIFYNNDFEVFIDPSPKTLAYGEIEVNALNTIWDLKLDKPYRVGGKADNNWNITDIKSAVKIYGSLNNPNDIDSLWTVEMAIPLSTIEQIDKMKPNTVDDSSVWRINFSRVEWDFDIIDGIYYRKRENGTFLPEYNWVWSNQKVINMHEPEKWGYLQFSDSINTKKVKPKLDPNLEIIQAGYALFRQIHNGDLKYLKEEANDNKQPIRLIVRDSKDMVSYFTKSNDGYTISFTDQSSQHQFTIDEEGQLNKTKKQQL